MQDLKNHASKRQTSFKSRQKKYNIKYGKKNLSVSSQGKQNSPPSQPSPFKQQSPLSGLKSPFAIATYLIRSWYKTLLGLGTLVFLLWLLTGIILLSNSYSQQPLDQIYMEGYSFLTPTRIYQTTGIDANTRFSDIDVYATSNRLNHHPMVEQAQIRKLFPGHLSISLIERRPYAHIKVVDTYYLIDRQFYPLQKVPAGQAKQHPVLTGIKVQSVQLGEPLLSPALEKGIQLIELIRESGIHWNDIAELDVSERLNLKLKLRSHPLVIQLGQDNYLEKIQTFEKIYSQLLQADKPISSIDLRYKNKAIVR